MVKHKTLSRSDLHELVKKIVNDFENTTDNELETFKNNIFDCVEDFDDETTKDWLKIQTENYGAALVMPLHFEDDSSSTLVLNSKSTEKEIEDTENYVKKIDAITTYLWHYYNEQFAGFEIMSTILDALYIPATCA